MAAETAPVKRASAAEVPEGAEDVRWWRREWFRETLAVAFVALSALALGVITYRLWQLGSLNIPISSAGDNATALSSIQTLEQVGTYQHNPRLGWPLGQDLYDFTANPADNAHFFLLWLFSRFMNSAPLVENLFLLLTFPLASVSSYGMFRWLGVSRTAAIVPAILFAIVPFHFVRAPYGHLFLAEYAAVPAGLLLAFAVMLGRPLFARRAGGRRALRWATWRTSGTLALCVVVASCGVYYWVFTLFAVAVAAAVALLNGQEARRTLLASGTVFAAVFIVFLVHMLPTFAYQREHGANPAAGTRMAMESEVYGFKIAQFVLPMPTHRVNRLAQYGKDYDAETTARGEGSSWPGTLPLIGLALALAALLARALRDRRPQGLLGDPRLAAAGVLAVAFTALGTLGGGGALIAWVLNPSIRAWTRVSIVIAFLGFVALALLLDRVRRRGPILAVGLSAVAVFGILDQTSSGLIPDYKTARAEWDSDARFVAAIEQRLDGEGEIYQVPYIAFPESPPQHKMVDYSLLKGHIHAGPGLRWSYGAMRGRPEDIQYWLAPQSFDVQLRAAAAMGFDGVWIDTFGYLDPPSVVALVQRLTDSTPLESDNGRLKYFPLRSIEDEGARRAALDPLRVSFNAGLVGPTYDATGDRWDAAPEAVLSVETDRPRRMRIRARLVSAAEAPVTFSVDDRVVADWTSSPTGEDVNRTITLEPGEHKLEIESAAGVQLRELAITDPKHFMKAIILAGGLGTRLSEETSTRPKPMVEIGGKPILWHIMKVYSSYGINEFIVCLGYKGYMIKEYFANYYLHTSDVTFDVANNAMQVHQSTAEPWLVTLADTGDQTQTGGRLRRVRRYLEPGETFCLTYGDGLADVDLEALIAFHQGHHKLATVTAVQPPGRFGAMQMGDGVDVSGFQEKPEDGGWINGGFFVLDEPAIDYVEGDHTLWEREPMEGLARDGQLTAYRHNGYWQAMDTLREKGHLENLWESGQAPWKRW